MSDNDLIKRGVAREILRDELDDIAAMDEASVDNIVDSIPSAVPQEEAVAIVKKWAREHPEKRHKTYAEDFFEKFPNAEPKYYDGRGKEQMIPIPCRQHCYGVVGQKCNGIGCSCSACWNEEMEDADE